MTQFNGSGYGEIRSPMQKGVIPVIIEVDFHDNPATARYIIDNEDSIAATLVKAITATLGIIKKEQFYHHARSAADYAENGVSCSSRRIFGQSERRCHARQNQGGRVYRRFYKGRLIPKLCKQAVDCYFHRLCLCI